MEALVAAGRVSVNGQSAGIGLRVVPGDRIAVDGKPVHQPQDNNAVQVLMYHKPMGEMVTMNDPEGRPTVFEHLPRLRGKRWVAVGRLDYNTSGLLLFTDSGDLANRLMHPRAGLEREYAVRVRGELSPEQIKQMAKGISLDDGPAHFDRIQFQGGEGANRWYGVSLKEGRNREVRRMFESFGMVVSRLIRVRFGPLTLPSSLPRGKWRLLESQELAALMAATDSAVEMREYVNNSRLGIV
jgi:23S rRNA pseudouridine2605 synthase